MATSEQIRLLLVEDVAQVSQYVRNLLQHQKQVRLLDTVSDGRAVMDHIRELRPDALMVDALLQGKVNGLDVAEQVRHAGLRIPIIIVTVPQKPVKVGEGMGIVEVLSMPFSGYELMNALTHSNARYRASAPTAMSRSYVVYSGKGGVGRTTIAYNLAVSFGQMPGVRVVLIDGDLQFSDLRGLLRVPDTAPSILQLPTDRIAESDLASVLWRDPSGIDLLLAPPRVEQAEMVTARDMEKVVSLLRRIYNVIVIDSPPAINDTTLAFLDDADSILSVVTPDRNSVRNARLAGQAFVAAGMSPHKMMLIMNRAGSPGIKPEQMAAELGRLPDVSIPDDQPLVKATSAEGVPFVLAQPKAKASQEIMGIAQRLMAPSEPAPAPPAAPL
ncbi:MAG TPA: AAA family ATPase, partial [Candidatus Limnocylindrales bacterium]|nr:AAA family ATPase [Candidatus Limnocylindrales bacterium]